MFTLAAIQEWLTAIQSLVTIAAIVVGGAWGWKLYRQNREKAPRAEIELHVASQPVTINRRRYTLLRLKVVIHNRGKVLLKLKQGILRIQQVDPLPLDFDASGKHQARTQSEADWPLMAEKTDVFSDTNPSPAIEPNEHYESIYDVLVTPRAKKIDCYFFLKNDVVKSSIGWEGIIHYDLEQGKMLL